MQLAVDIGNTNTVVGVYKGETLKDHFRVSSNRNMTSDEAGFFITGLLERMKIPNEEIEKIVVASVVPTLTPVIERTSKKFFSCIPIFVTSHSKLPIKITIDQPDQLGADRIANGVAGFTKFGGPIVIVDFGTTTNFDVVDGNGNYLGGVLIPGPETSMTELAKKAARLFEVRIEPPDRVIGRSTAGALKSGLFYGTIGQVDYLVDMIIAEAGFTNARVVATGGLAAGIEKYSRHIKLIEPTLTLEGIRLIGELN
jgi:type III pantothenate kinase